MKRDLHFLSILCLCLSLTSALSCTAGDSTAEKADPPAEANAQEKPGLAELVPYGGEPWPGIVTGGQPTEEDLTALRDAGLRSVINLRVPTERGTRDEPQWAETLGLTYVSIPVAGAAGLSEEVAYELDQALQTIERPVLVHCGSSNRVGAAFALRAFHLEGANAEEALEIGLGAGLTRLEGTVREMLAD